MAERQSRTPIIGLLAGSGVSLLGTTMTLVAIPWFVLQTTGSAARTGIASAFWLVPVIFAGVLGGPIVDRLGHRRAILIADLAGGVAIGTIPLLHNTVGLQYWQLLALIFLRGMFDIPGRTARRAMMPELARMAAMPLERANSSFVVIRDIGSLAGPSMAGILIAVIGAGNVLWIDAATYFASAMITAALIPAPGRTSGESEGGAGYFTELVSGFRFVRGHRLIFALLASSAAVSLLSEPLYGVVLPVYSDVVLESAVSLGLILAGFGAGSLAGTFLYGLVGHRLPRRPVLIGALLAMGIPFLVLATLPSAATTFGVVALAGFASAPFTILYATLLQEEVPEELRGRVFGLDTTIGVIGMTLGVVFVGFLIEVVGLRTMLVAQGIAFMVVACWLLTHPALRTLPRNAEEIQMQPK